MTDIDITAETKQTFEVAEADIPAAAEEHQPRRSRADLEAEIATMREQNQTLITQNQTQMQRIHTLQDQNDAFRQKVVEVAVDEARRREWCDEIKDVLERLDLEWPEERYEATATIQVTFRARRDGGLPSEDWVRNSINLDREWGGYNGQRLLLALDGDNEDVEITSYEVVTVDSVEAHED